MEMIRLMWPEEQFRENDLIVYRVRCLSYPNSIALIKISPHDYQVFKGDYDLKLGEIITVYRIAKNLMDDYFRYSS